MTLTHRSERNPSFWSAVAAGFLPLLVRQGAPSPACRVPGRQGRVGGAQRPPTPTPGGRRSSLAARGERRCPEPAPALRGRWTGGRGTCSISGGGHPGAWPVRRVTPRGQSPRQGPSGAAARGRRTSVEVASPPQPCPPAPSAGSGLHARPTQQSPRGSVLPGWEALRERPREGRTETQARLGGRLALSRGAEQLLPPCTFPARRLLGALRACGP